MAIRGAKLAFAICAGIAATCLLTLLPRVATVAAEDCLTEPTGATSEGQHWYYRFEKGSNRRCWYMKDPAQKQAQPTATSSSSASSSWDFAQPAAVKPGPRRSESTVSRASTDALAEASPKLSVNASSADKVAPDTTTGLQRGLGGSSWPQPQTPQPLDTALPDSMSAADAMTTADDAAIDNDPNSAPTATEVPAAAPAKPAPPPAQIHKLLMVVIGALALSGLLASAVYRLGKVGRRHRRNANWQRAVARARRARAKPRSKPKATNAGSRTGITSPYPADVVPQHFANSQLDVSDAAAAKAVDPAAALLDLLQTHAVQPPALNVTAAASPKPQPEAAVIAAPEPVDPAAELVNLLESRLGKPAANKPAAAARPDAAKPEAAKSEATKPQTAKPDTARPGASKPAAGKPPARTKQPAPQPAEAAARSPQPLLVTSDRVAREAADHAAELANFLESRGARPVAPPAKTAAARGSATPPPAADIAISKLTDPAAELAAFLGTQHVATQGPANARPATPPAKATSARPGHPQPAAAAPTSKVADPAAELAAYLESRDIKPAPRPAKIGPPRSVSPPPAVAHAAAPEASDPTAELEAYLATRDIKPAERPVKAGTAGRVNSPPAAGEHIAPPKILDPTAALLDDLEARVTMRQGKPTPSRTANPAPEPPAAKPAERAAAPVEPRAPRRNEPGMAEPRLVEPRLAGPRLTEPRPTEPRPVEPRLAEPRLADPRQADRREARPAKPAAKPAIPRNANPAAATSDTARPKAATANADPVEHRQSKVARPAARPTKAVRPRSANPPPAAVDIAAAKVVDSAAELVNYLENRAAKPASRQAPVSGRRPVEIEARRPVSDADDDGQSPPLDFIPRPQALRPRIRSIRQDESLDGIEDILARLDRHAKAK